MNIPLFKVFMYLNAAVAATEVLNKYNYNNIIEDKFKKKFYETSNTVI